MNRSIVNIRYYIVSDSTLYVLRSEHGMVTIAVVRRSEHGLVTITVVPRFQRSANGEATIAVPL